MAVSQCVPRLFTVDEANKLLPILRPVIERIFRNLEFLKKKSEATIRTERLSPDSPDLMERLREDDAIARLIQEIKGLVDEIHSFGCVCKGIEDGLVDFPCLLGGEIVYLCWRYDEESVGHWHRTEDGFAGRRPLLEAGETEGNGNASFH